jgi:PAS domain S-box-containing protein
MRKPSIDALFQKYRHHYILVMMIVTRMFGAVGGLGVIYYVDFAQNLPQPVRLHFWLICVAVCTFSILGTVLIALRDTRQLRAVLRKLDAGDAFDSAQASRAGSEAVSFPARHHWFEAWYVPVTTYVPCVTILKLIDDISPAMVENITAACTMAISMAVMCHFFATERCMQPVIKHLLDHGVPIDYASIRVGRLRFRLSVSFCLIIMTTALMIGTLARQRTAEIIQHPETQAQAIASLRAHTTYVTVAAVVAGAMFSLFLANSIAGRIDRLIRVMNRVQQGALSERAEATGNDEIDVLARQFNAMAQSLGQNIDYVQGILSSIRQSVVVTNNDGAIETVNPETCAVTGWSSEELAGRPLSQLLRATKGAGRHESPAADLTATLLMHGEGTLARCKGDPVPVYISSAPVQGDAGSPRGFVFVATDISQRLRFENELREAKEAAEAANVAKSQFLANMSHEIRTPLNAILGFADLLRQGIARDDEHERQEYLETIHTSGKHLLGLINDVLDISKIEAGRLELELTKCSPHALIAEVISVLRVRANEKGLSLEYRWSSVMPESIETDPARFRQLLMNLIGNAIKFTKAGKVSVVAYLLNKNAERKLAIEVRDTGVGIPAECLESIFEPFVQADSSVTRRFGGTGLGLAISRRIVTALGGTLTVRSEVRKGSVFTATVPTGPLDEVRLLEFASTDAVIAAKQEHELKAPIQLRARILVVEDGETNRKLVSLILRRAGAEVLTAENGLLGAEMALASRFDLILMDMQMPVMDGFTATARLRKRGLEIPILALTAHAMVGDDAKCRAAGCSGYIAKPVDPDLLLQAVSDALGSARACGTRAATENGATEGPIHCSLPLEDPAFREIAEEFAQSFATKLECMNRARDGRDLEELARLAHWLKGAGGTAGFNVLNGPARQLEKAVRSEDLDQIERILADITSITEGIAAGLGETAMQSSP